MSNILSGVIIIGIGFTMGGSIFLGDFDDPLNFVFDGLGVFFIIKGIRTMIKGGE